MRAQDEFVHRWKADRQVGHPVILARPAKMIGRAGFSNVPPPPLSGILVNN